jgi:hypothetical protein
MDSAVNAVLSAQQGSTANQVSMTVLKKAMDVQQQQGAQVVQMIKDAGAAAQGGRTASGGVDVYA